MEIEYIVAIIGVLIGGAGVVPWIQLHRTKVVDNARNIREVYNCLEEAYDTIIKYKSLIIELEAENSTLIQKLKECKDEKVVKSD